MNGLSLLVILLQNLFIIASGTPPTPRAAHAATCVEELEMVVYGGATGGTFMFYLFISK